MSIFTNASSGADDTAEDYISAILELLGDRDPRSVLAETESEVRAALEGIPAEVLRRPEAPGKWSMLEVVHHLADSELVWGWRLRRVLAEDRPPLTGFDQDLWASHLGYRNRPLADALEPFAVLRRVHLQLLGGLDAFQLQRVGVHSERGEESVAHMMRLYAGHDLVHRTQLGRIRSAVL